VFRSLSEIKYRQPTHKIERALDFGAGTGASAFAIEELFPQIQKINAIEPSSNMSQVGKKLTRFSDKIQ